MSPPAAPAGGEAPRCKLLHERCKPLRDTLIVTIGSALHRDNEDNEMGGGRRFAQVLNASIIACELLCNDDDVDDPLAHQIFTALLDDAGTTATFDTVIEYARVTCVAAMVEPHDTTEA